MRGKTKEEILKAIAQVFREHNLTINSIKAIATIEIKKDEPGILETCQALGCELKIYTTDQIKQVQHLFNQSQFVQSQIGIPAVCEPCAYLAGGEIIVNKTALNGVTVAVAREGKGIEH
jgi:cobalt-precorrin 5A hydrolase